MQTRCCGSISCCVVEQWHCSHCSTTQHDMLPQHLVCKYELNCEYCNITLGRNKAPWWWSDKIETCRSVLKCFKIVLCDFMCIRWLINGSHSINTRCFNEIYNNHYVFCRVSTVFQLPFIIHFSCIIIHTSLLIRLSVLCAIPCNETDDKRNVEWIVSSNIQSVLDNIRDEWLHLLSKYKSEFLSLIHQSIASSSDSRAP